MSDRTYTASSPASPASQPGGPTLRTPPTHCHASQSPHQPDCAGHHQSPQSALTIYPRRNVQLQLPPRTRRSALPYAEAAPGEIGPHKCPYCNYTGNRKPDLRRHMETHTGGSTPPRWICGGVPLAEARQRRIDTEGMPVYVLDGQERVGGCLKAFSRRDARLRHWRTTGGRCIEE